MPSEFRTRKPVCDGKGRRITGLYIRDGRYIAGFEEPGTRRWRTVTLAAEEDARRRQA